MKKFAGHIAAIVTLAAYLIANVGFGIHFCSIERSATPILLFDGVSCEDIHVHHHEASHYCCHHDNDCDCCECCYHSAECCTTEILVITDAQEKKDLHHVTAPSTCIIPSYIECSILADASSTVSNISDDSARSFGRNQTHTALRL